jgi:uncharacterized membrane protein YozB (DUF420 family)
MITLLISILILLLIFGVLFYVVDLIPFGPPQLKWAIHAVLALILIVILLEFLLGGLPHMRLA